MAQLHTAVRVNRLDATQEIDGEFIDKKDESYGGIMIGPEIQKNYRDDEIER